MRRSGIRTIEDLYIFREGAPTVNDDESNGILVGQRWIDLAPTPHEEYVCLNTALGAALWENTTSGSAKVVLVDGTDGFVIDASLGKVFDLYLDGSNTLDDILNPYDAQKIELRVTNRGEAGDSTLGFAEGLIYWTSSVPEPVISVGLGKVTIIMLEYSLDRTHWRALAVALDD